MNPIRVMDRDLKAGGIFFESAVEIDPADERVRLLLVATSGCSGHAAGPTALPLKADLQAEMSASPPISSASPPGADLPGDAPVRLVLTQNGHPGLLAWHLRTSRNCCRELLRFVVS